jgi:endo-1,4-beta-xylanase
MMMSCRGQSGSSLLAITVCFAVTVGTGCTSSETVGGSAGSTGTPIGGAPAAGSSGAAPTSGASNSGGVSGSDGVSGPAGAPGVGGAPSLGGAPGSSGSPGGAGSSAGSAGSNAGNGGTSGTGGSPTSAGASSGGGGAASTCPTAKPLTGGMKYCANEVTGNAGGGYSYEVWANKTGTGCMTVYGVDAKFSATWTGADDFLARIGLSFDHTKTPAQIGTISADFAETKTGGDGLVYVGIYGWTDAPLREYYILDDWGSTKPAGVASDGTPRDSVGTITVDGGTYDVWKKTRTNKPAITGDNKTFDQYFSIRQTPRQCGHISISEHFSKWIGLGLQLGKLYEAKILLEAQDSSGSIDFTTAAVVVK